MKKSQIKVLRDIKKYKERILALFLILFIGPFLFSGLMTFQKNFNKTITNYCTEYNLADLWVSYSNITEDNISKLHSIPGIDNLNLRNTFLASYDSSTLKVHSLCKDYNINKPFIVSGSIPTSENDILLDSQYAEAHNLGVGDSLELTVNKKNIHFNITGLCESVEYIWKVEHKNNFVPNHDKFGIAYVADASLKNIFGSIVYNELLVDINKDYIYNDIFINDDIQSKTKDFGYIKSFTRNSTLSYRDVRTKANIISLFSNVLGYLLLIISFIVSFITLKGFINIKKDEIYIMKCLGVSDFSICSPYLLFAFVMGITASFIGSLLGSLIIPNIIFHFASKIYTLPILVNNINFVFIFPTVLFSTITLIFSVYFTLKNNFCNQI